MGEQVFWTVPSPVPPRGMRRSRSYPAPGSVTGGPRRSTGSPATPIWTPGDPGHSCGLPSDPDDHLGVGEPLDPNGETVRCRLAAYRHGHGLPGHLEPRDSTLDT